MHDAAKRKSGLTASLTTVRCFLLLIVACCGLQTRLRSFAAPLRPASDQVAFATRSFVGDIRAAGFDVVPAPTENNPFHVRIVSGENTFDAVGRDWLSTAFDRIARAKKGE